MVAYTFSKLPTANFNTTPPSIARSATGSVYDVGDTGFTTPLNMTMVIGGAVTTTISSDALGFLPDFTLDGRVNCVWKQTGSSFATVLTTSDPIPGPAGPNTVPTQAAIQSEVTTPGTPTDVALKGTYAPMNGSTNYASMKVFDNTTTAADITAWLAAASPLGVKRSIGDATISTAVVLPSNLNWDATGTTLTLAATAAQSMLTNDWTNGNSNVKINGLTLNGNRSTSTDPRSPASWHAIYLQKVTSLTLDNVTVLWPLAFGGLIVNSTDIYLTNYRTHSEHINQDGIHFFDCQDVTVDGIHGVAGDDLLGISAQYADVRNFTVSNVIGTSKHASLVRVNQTDRSVAAAETRTIENMTFSGLVGYDCANKGFTLNDVYSSSTVRNIRVVDSTFIRTARSGVDIVRAQDSEFDVTLIDCGTGIGITDFLTLHPFYAMTLIRSRVHARIINVKDGYNGINIAGGNSLIINPEIQYPTSGFTNAQNCIFLGSVTDSLIADGYTDGGGRAVQLGSSTLATLRTRVKGLLIRNNTGFSIAEGSLSDSNLIEGNYIRNGGVSKVGSVTKARRNDGVYVTENSGVATIASGGTSITFNHGLNATPTVVLVTGKSAETANSYVTSITSSQIQVTVPTAVTAARDVMWRAEA